MKPIVDKARMPWLSRRGFVGMALAGAGFVTFSLPGARKALSAIDMPPQILQPGTRVVWIGGAASIPGERYQLEPDFNGALINKRTDERYTQFETPGAAGAGFVIADVLAAEPRGFLLWISQLQIHPDTGGTTFTDFDGMLAGAQNIRDFWISPAQLTQIRDRNDPDSRVLHLPYALDGKTYRAVGIKNRSGDGWSQHTYHLDTGLCLVASSTAQGAPVRILGLRNLLETGAGSTQVTYLRIAGIRQTSLPGPGAVFPEAARRLRAMTYSGTTSVVVDVGGVRTQTFPIHVNYNITSNAGAFLVARKSVSGTRELQDRVIAAGVVGSLWMNPETFDRYGPGQMLDHDAITGMQTRFVGRQDNLAFFAHETRLARFAYGYDLQSGLLTSAELRTRNGPVTNIISLRLTAAQ